MAAAEPVGSQVSVAVPEAKAVEFEALLHQLIDLARTYPGHLGADVLRPAAGGEYQVLFRFASAGEHAAWMESPKRAELVAKITTLLDARTPVGVRSVDGWEGWFVQPGYAPPVPPRRWKMAVLTLVALYPLVLALNAVLRPVTRALPLPVSVLVVVALTVPLTTWFIMPWLTRRAGAWLRH